MEYAYVGFPRLLNDKYPLLQIWDDINCERQILETHVVLKNPNKVWYNVVRMLV